MGTQFETIYHLKPESYVAVLNHLLEMKDPHVSRVPISEYENGYKVTEEPDGKGRYLIFHEYGDRFEYRVRSGDVYREVGREADMGATMWATHWLGNRWDNMNKDMNLAEDERADNFHHASITTDADGNQPIYASEQWPGIAVKPKGQKLSPEPESKSKPPPEPKPSPKPSIFKSLLNWFEDLMLRRPFLASSLIFLAIITLTVLLSAFDSCSSEIPIKQLDNF